MELSILEIIKVVFLGIVEGITEWLPISSTGHMLLVDEFIHIDAGESFKEMFFVVIQLGAIIAVIVYFWKKMFPFQFSDRTKPVIRKDVFSIWFKVVVACMPGTIITLLFDDFIEAHLHTPVVIAAALIFYGAAFILVESADRGGKRVAPGSLSAKTIDDISYKTALVIGLFQMLSIIPGTSRSGSTIIGALIIGVSRVAAAEFSFFLAVPVIIGLSGIKLLKFGLAFSSSELVILLVGMVTAFIVSMLAVRFLMAYIKKHDFKAFGVYRIVLGAVVLAYFLFIA